MTDSDIKITNKIEIRTDLVPPSNYSVIFVNDNVTTVEFVIAVLISIFSYEHPDALIMTQKIHEDGLAVVAVYSYEMAEQKALETTMMARNNSFPLMVKIEPSS